MRIRWTEPAARDLSHICDFTEEQDGPAAPQRVALQTYGALGSLRSFRELVVWVANQAPANWYSRACPFLLSIV
jgi:hypothetical protein